MPIIVLAVAREATAEAIIQATQQPERQAEGHMDTAELLFHDFDAVLDSPACKELVPSNDHRIFIMKIYLQKIQHRYTQLLQ